MESIRKEIQNWLELNTRKVKNIPFDKEVDWTDIEDVANGDHAMSIKWEKFGNRTFHWVHSDAVAIDHMCLDILNGDFEMAMQLIERYRGVKLTEDKCGFKKELRSEALRTDNN